MDDPEYIAACELCGPNAAEFEHTLLMERRKAMLKLTTQLKQTVFELRKEGRISDEVTHQAWNHLSMMFFED